MKTVLLFPIIAAFGCAHSTQVKSESPTSSAAHRASSSPIQAAAASTVGICSSDLDCGSGQLCIRTRCENISSGLAECKQLRVNFPFNSSELDSTDRASLDRGARCLKGDQALHVTIEGNADERGTEEYNLALGDRRATAVATYLERVGASQNQLKTVSYGKENPLCTVHDEECWSKNRRADLKVADAQKNGH